MTRVLPLAISTAVVLSWIVPAAAQAPAARPRTATAAKWTPPKTPWGHPDLQGEWTSDSARGIPRERPAEFAGRAELTDQELADRIKRDEQTIKNAVAATGAQTGGRVDSGAAPRPSGRRRSSSTHPTAGCPRLRRKP